MAKRAGKPEPAKTLTVLPVQLRPGDTFTDDAGTKRGGEGSAPW